MILLLSEKLLQTTMHPFISPPLVDLRLRTYYVFQLILTKCSCEGICRQVRLVGKFSVLVTDFLADNFRFRVHETCRAHLHTQTDTYVSIRSDQQGDTHDNLCAAHGFHSGRSTENVGKQTRNVVGMISSSQFFIKSSKTPALVFTS